MSKEIILEAIKMAKAKGVTTKADILNALNWLAQIHGWDNDNAYDNFVTHATTSFRKWLKECDNKPTGVIVVNTNDDIEALVRYVQFVAADEIKAAQ